MLCYFLSFALFFLFPILSSAQNKDIESSKDTIRYDYYTGGVLDSLDISFSKLSSTLPGGLSTISPIAHQYDFFFLNEGGSLIRPNFQWKEMRFSAIPHLGFGTIFGNQATQIIRASYTQAFVDHTLLNIDYDKHQGNSFLRSSDFSHHKLRIQIERIAKNYSFRLRSNYGSNKIGHSGGVASDSLLNLSPLAFLPTNKSNADSKYQKANIGLEHFLHIRKLDSLRSEGFYLSHEVVVSNRKYREADNDLSQIYSTILISKDSTKDQFQQTKFINSLGIYHKDNNLFIQFGVQHIFWKYHNLGFFTHSSEINTDLLAEFKYKNFLLTHNTNVNLISAKGEWHSDTKIQSTIDKFEFSATAMFSSLLPQVYQRNYHGNNLLYGTTFNDLKRQLRSNITAEILYKKEKTTAGIFAKTAFLKDNYWFYDDRWRSDTLKNVNSLSLGIIGTQKVHVFNGTISASYNIGEWVPKYLLQMRLFVQGKMFKERKLKGQFGVEFSYNTAYRLFEVIPLMDVYRMSNIFTDSRSNLHVFGAFEIQRFRFFFRLENIAYAWTANTQQLAVSYPIPTQQLRVGITWDFFN